MMPPDPIQTVDEMAIRISTWCEALTKQGFSRHEALYLTGQWIHGLAVGAGGPA
jgi:hypothetical protein